MTTKTRKAAKARLLAALAEAATIIEEFDPQACTQIEWDKDVLWVAQMILNHGRDAAYDSVARTYKQVSELSDAR